MGKIINFLRPSQFVSGCISTICAISLIQDWYGLEGYIAHLRDYWVDSAYTVPVAVIIWLWCAVTMRGR